MVSGYKTEHKTSSECELQEQMILDAGFAAAMAGKERKADATYTTPDGRSYRMTNWTRSLWIQGYDSFKPEEAEVIIHFDECDPNTAFVHSEGDQIGRIVKTSDSWMSIPNHKYATFGYRDSLRIYPRPVPQKYASALTAAKGLVLNCAKGLCIVLIVSSAALPAMADERGSGRLWFEPIVGSNPTQTVGTGTR